jgi:hypothetical protein
MSGLFKSPKIPKPKVIEMPDPQDLEARRKRKMNVKKQMSRGGRAASILSDRESKMGG